ncbi:MAG: integrase, partial [Bacteroidota bacterium]
MKARAAAAVYWPGINAAIQGVRDRCRVCNKIQPSQPREPLQLLPAPEYPFQQICMDAFEMCGQNYIAIVDKFSNWINVFHIKVSPKSKHVIESLRSTFTVFGAPLQVFSDGGLSFQAAEVKEFLLRWKVEHVTSSASYLQGNGRAELAVKTAKRILQENTGVGGNLNCDRVSAALLQYRNTPIKHLGLSPAQLLFHRNLRDDLPIDPTSLRPSKLWVIAAREREEEFAKRNHQLISRYNNAARQLPILKCGTHISIQDSGRGGRWTRFGVIVDRMDRKYVIRVHGSGRVITRNRRFIKPVLYPESTEIYSDNSPSDGGDDIIVSNPPMSSHRTPPMNPR